MRIIFICNEFPPAPGGGIGTIVKTMAQSLAEAGVNVIVVGYDVTMQSDQTTEENGILVFRLFDPYVKSKQFRLGRFYISLNSFFKRMYLSRKVEDLIEQYNPDLVESYDWSGPLWKKPSVPLVIRLHGSHAVNGHHSGRRASRLLYYFEKRQLSQADSICAVSNHIAQVTLNHFKIKKPTHVLYNSTDTTIFKSRTKVNRDFNRLLFVGRIVQQKGLEELFATVNILFDQDAELYLDVVGPYDPQFRIHLLNLLDDEKKGRIRFEGHIANHFLPDMYSSAGLFLMPSRVEAFGITAIEAMSCETVVVISPGQSSPEIVEHDRTGYILDFSKHAIAANLLYQWLQDHNKLNRIGRAAREEVVRKFSVEKGLEANLKYYQTLLN